MRIAVFGLLFLSFLQFAEGADERLISLYGSKGAYDVVAHPEKIIGYTLRFEASPIVTPKRDALLDDLEGRDEYFISTSPLRLQEDEITRIASLLAAPGSFTWSEEPKECFPEYNIRLVFEREGQQVVVELCFGCDILRVLRSGDEERVADFDLASSQLLSLCRKLFPKDRVLKEIEAVRKNRSRAQALEKR
ncbi:MAG TPA: hypothetical protein PLN52_10815 [Opitutaceae bacterium]|nr:hypothetical protein [Opitutaceae bacterium]